MEKAWIFAATLIACCSQANPPKSAHTSKECPSKEVQCADKAQDSHYPTKDAPLPITVLQSPEDAAHSAEREQKADADQSDYLITQKQLASVAIPTIAISAIGAAISFLALVFLWKTYQETKRTAGAAIRSADAAMAAVGSDRAWMTYDEVTIGKLTNGVIDGVEAKEGILLYLQWKNRGRSPAIKAEIVVDFLVIDASIEEIPAFISNWSQSGMSTPVGPDACPSTPTRAFGEELANRVWEKRSHILVYSAMRYRDIFNSSIERKSEVCIRIVFNGMRKDGEGKPVPFWEIRIVGPQNTAT